MARRSTPACCRASMNDPPTSGTGLGSTSLLSCGPCRRGVAGHVRGALEVTLVGEEMRGDPNPPASNSDDESGIVERTGEDRAERSGHDDHDRRTRCSRWRRETGVDHGGGGQLDIAHNSPRYLSRADVW